MSQKIGNGIGSEGLNKLIGGQQGLSGLKGKKPMDIRIEQLQKEIQKLKADKADRERALPAHSIRPNQILVIEELEEAIAAKQEELKGLLDPPPADE
jgi:uncharacterized small protein (DUF1192 family)